MGLGTLLGGWRIVKTMGSQDYTPHAYARLLRGDRRRNRLSSPPPGLAVPVSTTHTITGAIMGVGAARRVSAVRWSVAHNIVVAWIITIPASAAIAAIFYGLTRFFG